MKRTKTNKRRGVGSKTTKRVPSRGAKAANRAEGVRLFTLAGRPSKSDFIKVYGVSGPKMTWAQRAAAGIPAAKFQAALAKRR